MRNTCRTWAEIHLDRAAHNFKEIAHRTGSEVIAVVKADAYGHGAIPLARLYEELGAAYLAVACVQEGIELRENGITAPILILGLIPDEEIDVCIEHQLTMSLYSRTFADAVPKVAASNGKRACVHLKLDTGMSRIGFRFDAIDEILAAARLPQIDVEGAFMHFADAEREDQSFSDLQFERFETAVDQLRAEGLALKICHCANSAAVLHYKRAHLGFVRAGIILYGWQAGARVDFLQPVMEFKTRVLDLRTLQAGDTVSYGRTYTATTQRKIAVVPAGYADGVSRALSGCGTFRVRGVDVPICGRVCMDMTMLDVTDVPDVKIGDEVTIFGQDASADTLADKAGTISYELCCNVSKRVPRIYFSPDGNQIQCGGIE